MIDWLSDCEERRLIAPSYAEIAEKFGFESIEQARTLIAQLSDAGMIRMKPAGRDRFTFEIRRRDRAPKPEPLKLGNLDVGLQEMDEIEAGVARIRSIHQRLKARDSVEEARPAPPRVTVPYVRPAPTPTPAKPAGDRQINIRISAEMFDQVAAAAEAGGVTVSNIVRRIFLAAMCAPDGRPRVKADAFRMWRQQYEHLSLADFCTMLMDEGLQRLALQDDGK